MIRLAHSDCFCLIGWHVFFFQREESPENCLFEYLKRYKEICEKIALNEVDIAECEQLVKNCSANVWTVENRVLNQEVH